MNRCSTPASYVGAPLTLAAAATAAGFLSFLPTDYKGLSELGLLAGLGMIIAFLTSVTVIPALLTTAAAAGRAGRDGIQGARAGRPVHGAAPHPGHRRNRARGRGRAAAALLAAVRLQSRSTCGAQGRSVATFLELRSDPALGANSIFVLTPNREAADADMERLAKLPEVSQRQDDRELHSRRSAAQARRHPPARDRARPGAAAGSPTRSRRPMPTTSPRSRPRSTACAGRPARKGPGAAPPPQRLADDLAKLADGDEARAARAPPPWFRRSRSRSTNCAATCRRSRSRSKRCRPRSRAMGHVGRPLQGRDPAEGRSQRQRDLARVRARCRRSSRTPSAGRSRSSKSGRTVIRAFFEAGFWALASIAILLLWIVLRRFGDVLLTLMPLLLAGVVTHGADGAARHAAQLRQHHRAAAAARRRRRLQDLLHHGVAGRADRPAAIEPDPRGDLQRADHRDRVRQPVAVEPSRHVEHGQADGARARHHHGGGGAVPAGADGAAARAGERRRRSSCTRESRRRGLTMRRSPDCSSRRILDRPSPRCGRS